MRKYLLLALTLSMGLLILFTQRLTVATPQSGNSSTTNSEANTSLSIIGPSATVTPTVTMMATATEIPTVTPTPTQPKSYLPLIALQPTHTPTNTPIPTATPIPTVTPSPTPLYPRSPWLLQSGSTEYIHNDFMHWLEGDIFWPNGDPIEGFHVQICRSDGSACSGPSSGSGGDGHYDHVRYDGSNDKGDYYTVVVDCRGYEGNPGNSTIGHWPACEEHSERVYFEMDVPSKAIANVKWVLVDPQQD